MAEVPFYTFESNFDTGTTEWSAGEAADTDGRLSIDYFGDLARRFAMYPGIVPFRGAYALHADLSIAGGNDAYMQDVALATALGGTVWLRFYFLVTPDLVMASGDRFTIAALQSTGGVDEAVVCIRNNGGVLEVLGAETSATATIRACSLTTGVWHLAELGVVVDSGGGNGQVSFFMDGYQVGATITTLTQAAIAQLRLGVMGIDAGTTNGHILFDQVAGFSARIGGFKSRWEEVMQVTKTGFIALGPGKLEEYILSPGNATDCRMAVYDMDKLPLLAGTEPLGPPLANSFAFEVATFPYNPRYFARGVYVTLSGTQPRGFLKFSQQIQDPASLAYYGQTRTLT